MTGRPPAEAADRRRARDVRVLIVGGGGTGAAALHDLTARGFACTLVERGELTCGTTGRHHGQLHSGARYALGDASIARECMAEVTVLNRIAPGSIEMNWGLFLAIDDEGMELLPRFREACSAAGIPNRLLTAAEASRCEPGINSRARSAVLVPDGTIDAYRLPLRFFATARSSGALIRRFCRVISVDRAAGAVRGACVCDLASGREELVPAEVVVNAAGPWAGEVARSAGFELPLTPAPGTLVAVKGRLCNMVVSRLHHPADGDIVVPQRQLSIIGSTQRTIDDPDLAHPLADEIPWLLSKADELVEGFSRASLHAAWTAVRPLAGTASTGGRDLSRDYAVTRHGSGFHTIVGGKATVLRAMGRAVADAVCEDLGLHLPCETDRIPLRSHRDCFGVVP